jgi:hypothetical protein
MRSEEELLTQVVEKEIFCPCGATCIARPPVLVLQRDGASHGSKHEDLDQYTLCLSRYVAGFVQQRVRELRMHAEKNLRLPLETWRVFENGVRDDVYHDVVRSLKLHFVSTLSELDQLIISNLFVICDQAVAKARHLSA